MKVITLTSDEFDNYAQRHPYNTLYQSSNYGFFKEKNEQYRALYLGFKDNNNNLVGASLMLCKPLFWGYSFAYAPRGFLINYDDIKLINAVSYELKKYLRSKKIMFVTIDPPIIASQRDKSGNTIKLNDNINQLLTVFNKNHYEHFGFNIYNETKLPRWNVLAPLNANNELMFNYFDNEIKEKINYAKTMYVSAKLDELNDINQFLDFIKPKFLSKANYLKKLINAFAPSNKVKIFYTYLDTKKYVQNANNLYVQEEERNNNLAQIIQNGNNQEYNIASIVEEKIQSDKLLHQYKKDVVDSAKYLKSNPNGVTIGTALVIEEANGANILLKYIDKNYEKHSANEVLIYEIMKYYGKRNYQYLNLGSVTGNFNPNSRYYKELMDKMGFNSSVIEYIGQFNMIINPFMYQIYKKTK